MLSRVFIACIVIALGAVPSLIANPVTPGETATNITLAPSAANAGNSAAPLSSSTAGSNLATVATNATNASHPPSPAATSANTAVSAHGPTAESTPKALPANITASAPHSRPDVQPELPATPSCYSKKKSHGVETHHCEKALEKIVYAADQTLDKFSSVIFANYKTCNINVLKPRNATLTKIQVASMVRNVTGACHSVGGVLFKGSKIAVQVERDTTETVYPVDASMCKKEQCPLTQSDCMSAFYQIPLDDKGIFTCKNSTHSYARSTSGNCTVTVSTTDYSDFATPRYTVYPAMKKLFNDCGRHPGKIYLSGGTIGLNGNIKISTRPVNQDMCE